MLSKTLKALKNFGTLVPEEAVQTVAMAQVMMGRLMSIYGPKGEVDKRDPIEALKDS